MKNNRLRLKCAKQLKHSLLRKQQKAMNSKIKTTRNPPPKNLVGDECARTGEEETVKSKVCRNAYEVELCSINHFKDASRMHQ
jgi:hypothetical protein